MSESQGLKMEGESKGSSAIDTSTLDDSSSVSPSSSSSSLSSSTSSSSCYSSSSSSSATHDYYILCFDDALREEDELHTDVDEDDEGMLYDVMDNSDVRSGRGSTQAHLASQEDKQGFRGCFKAISRDR